MKLLVEMREQGGRSAFVNLEEEDEWENREDKEHKKEHV